MLDKPYKFKWTDENVALLTRMAREGASASEAGARIGCSRNAAIGKAMRLGVTFKSDLRRRASAAGDVISAALSKRRAESPWQKIKAAKAKPAEPEVIVVPIARYLGLTDLTKDTCRWPHGDPLEEGFGFCGVEPRHDSPYCPFHHRLAYRPRETAVTAGRRA